MTPFTLPDGTRASQKCHDVPNLSDVRAELARATGIALVRVAEVRGDCSGIGGYHATLEVSRVLRGPALTTLGVTQKGSGSGISSGDLLLALLEPMDPPQQRPADAKRCLPQLPTLDASATRLFPVDDERGAGALMELWSD